MNFHNHQSFNVEELCESGKYFDVFSGRFETQKVKFVPCHCCLTHPRCHPSNLSSRGVHPWHQSNPARRHTAAGRRGTGSDGRRPWCFTGSILSFLCLLLLSYSLDLKYKQRGTWSDVYRNWRTLRAGTIYLCLEQDWGNSSALALELPQSCTKPSIYTLRPDHNTWIQHIVNNFKFISWTKITVHVFWLRVSEFIQTSSFVQVMVYHHTDDKPSPALMTWVHWCIIRITRPPCNNLKCTWTANLHHKRGPFRQRKLTQVEPNHHWISMMV